MYAARVRGRGRSRPGCESPYSLHFHLQEVNSKILEGRGVALSTGRWEALEEVGGLEGLMEFHGREGGYGGSEVGVFQDRERMGDYVGSYSAYGGS